MEIRILDTNVLLNKPLEDVLNSLAEQNDEIEVIIPFVVLEELDRFKVGRETINVVCRATIRFLGNLITKHPGRIVDGIKYKKLIIKIYMDPSYELDKKKVDNAIIYLAKELGEDATIITEDIHERVLAEVNGVKAESANCIIDVKNLYTGIAEMKIPSKHTRILASDEEIPTKKKFVDNQFIKMEDENGTKSLGIYHKQFGTIENIKLDWYVNGIRSKKNKDGEYILEQSMLMYLLLNPEIQIITAVGPAGTGKTFLTLAAALEQTVRTGEYKKVLVLRPLVAIGEDIGAFPGSKKEKLTEWMGSMYDNVEVLLETMKFPDYRAGDPEGIIDEMMDDNVLEIESLSLIRGRSLPSQFIIIDDAQNLTVKQAISILTRAGEGSKIVFLGDINENQIDCPKLNSLNNGLTYLVDKLKGIDPIVGQVTMTETVRSKIAEIGVRIGEMDV